MKKLISSPSLSITSALKLLMVKSIAYVGGILISVSIMRNAPRDTTCMSSVKTLMMNGDISPTSSLMYGATTRVLS